MYLFSLLFVAVCQPWTASSVPSPLQDHAFGVPGNTSFDYVVVGGGTAGLTMAAKLATNPNISVAVIEAGGFYQQDNGNISVVPGYCTYYAGTSPSDTQPLVDWSFVTTPQAGAAGREMHYARGKTLGGSSARNYMLYQRPTVESLKQWAREVDDPTYEFDEFLPFFKEGIHYTSPNFSAFPNITVRDDPTAFGPPSGPLQVSWNNAADPFDSWVQKALVADGFSEIDGFNSGKLIGSGCPTFTIDPKDAKRSSSESSYLRQAVKNSTIKVYNNTLATQILFDYNKEANGVSVISGNISYTLSVKKEVIISAGAFQSPQLLMVSGIGPRDILRSHNISLVQDLPGVGQNLWDQPWFISSYGVDVTTASTLLNSPTALLTAEEEYQGEASGPLAISSSGVVGWEKLLNRSSLSAAAIAALATFPADWPEIEFLPVSAYLGNQSNYRTADPRDGGNYASLGTALLTPLSRGNISIQSSSMADPPLINPNWLTNPVDQEVAIAAFKRQRDLWSRLRAYGVALGEEVVPGPAVQTDAEILAWIHEVVAPVWHAAATCKMGTRNDSLAVIDSKAKVYGVGRLRVVDASSFPFLPPGHPQSTIYALAEKIAAEILKTL